MYTSKTTYKLGKLQVTYSNVTGVSSHSCYFTISHILVNLNVVTNKYIGPELCVITNNRHK